MYYEWFENSPIPELDKVAIHNHFLDDWNSLIPIGYGSNSIVYAYNERYAIKAFLKDSNNKRDFLILSKLYEYRYFPNLYYGVKSEEWEYIVVERLYGDMLSESKNYCPISVVSIITEAFYSSLEKGYLLNDINLRNIMLENSGDIKLLDVGAFIRISPDMHNYQAIVDNQYNNILTSYHCC